MRTRRPRWPARWRRRSREFRENRLLYKEQLERSHDARKLDVVEANKQGMGFNGL